MSGHQLRNNMADNVLAPLDPEATTPVVDRSDPVAQDAEMSAAAPTENGVESEPVEAKEEEAPEDPTESVLDKYWVAVQSNPLDFTSATYLVEVAAKEASLVKKAYLIFLTVSQGTIDQIRAAYNHFLTEFPLCYGYWKKVLVSIFEFRAFIFV
jgi:pre-mRNA-processing factor 39